MRALPDLSHPTIAAGQAPAGVAALVALALVLILSGSPADAQKRLALVVGNQTYQSVVSLDNPLADAELMADTLTAKGFDVTLLKDAGQVALNRAIAQFGRKLRSSGEDTTGLFYYAGHAVQSFGSNYLLPVDISLTDAADLSLVAVRADSILRQMASARNRTNIFILDACRNNPFVDIPDMNDNGLAEMKAPTGTFMAYSTAPGSVALDGNGNNSPFTEALAAEMDVAGLAIEQAFKQVRSRVLKSTRGLQTPWDSSSLTRDFFFTPAVQKSPEELAEQRFFESLKQTRDPVQMALFLRTYPDSEYFDEVRRMMTVFLGGGGSQGGPAPTTSEPAVTAAPARPAPAAESERAPRKTPEKSERELIAKAQASRLVADYQAYLDAYPDGVFAELARMEIETQTARDPDGDAGGVKTAAAPAPEPTTPASKPAPSRQTVDDDVFFDRILTGGGPNLAGKSIKDLIAGSPLFPPIEGLPEPVWKNQKCSHCHEWTSDRLCTQAKTYLADSGTRALGKDHPYGGGFKRALRAWATGGCR